MTTDPSYRRPGSPAHSRRVGSSIGATLRELRLAADLTLSQLAQRSNLAASTLSKIENDHMSPTYETIVALAEGLRVDVTELFAGRSQVPISGRRVITRKGQGQPLKIEQYDYEMLASDIAGKHFVPMVATIKAKSMEAFPTLFSHPGEEFIYVLTGQVTLHSEYYAPALLSQGDCCYFDSPMGHAVVATGDEPATVLWVCSRVVSPLTS